MVILNPDAAEYQQQLEDLANAPLISLDCETFGENKNDGLHPWNGDIRLIQLCIGDTTYIVDFGSRLEPPLHPSQWGGLKGGSHGQTVEVLKKAIANPDQKIVGHNLHFDLRFLATKLGIRNATNVACTLLGLKTFYGDYGGDSGNAVFKGGYSLENAAQRLLNITLDKSHQTSDWGAPLTPAGISYAAADAAVTFVLYQALENLYADEQHPLSSQTIREVWEVENQAIAPAIEIELTGMPVDLQLVNQQLS